MVWPCLYTALTTIMAFISLVVSGIKPVIDFGWMMTIGLSVTFLTSFILFPSLLILLPKTSEEKISKDEFGFTPKLASITEKYGNKILIFTVFLTIISIYGITRLQVENSFINYFSKSTEIYQGLRLIDEKLGGTTPVDILLNLEDSENLGLRHSDVIRVYEIIQMASIAISMGAKKSNFNETMALHPTIAEEFVTMR